MKINVMDVMFDNVSMDEAVARARTMLHTEGADYVVTPNAEIVYETLSDDVLRQLLNGASLVLPDGAGVVLGSKILGTPLREKVAGVDFADKLLGALAADGGSVYLLGGKPSVAEKAAENLLSRHSGLRIAGMENGYYKDEQAVVERINASRADVLFVCLGAPKQEYFMANHRCELKVRLMAGLGGSLDAFAGSVKRAPQWMINCSLEWLYRLIKEPRRWKRMLRLPKFVLAVIRRRLFADN